MGRPAFRPFRDDRVIGVRYAHPSGVTPRSPDSDRSCAARVSRRAAASAPLAARLYLVHDRDDGTFPVSEAYRLAGLARARGRVRMVVLEALQHVDPEPWRRDPWGFLARDLPEALRLVWWWYGLLGER